MINSTLSTDFKKKKSVKRPAILGYCPTASKNNKSLLENLFSESKWILCLSYLEKLDTVLIFKLLRRPMGYFTASSGC